MGRFCLCFLKSVMNLASSSPLETERSTGGNVLGWAGIFGFRVSWNDCAAGEEERT